MTPTVRLELTTPGLEVRCAIQLRQDGLVLPVCLSNPILKDSPHSSQYYSKIDKKSLKSTKPKLDGTSDNILLNTNFTLKNFKKVLFGETHIQDVQQKNSHL